MRALHRQALSEAEAKKTELKLVLASRYRELVGSSDEVLDMQRDAKVLDDLVTSIPSLVEYLLKRASSDNGENKEEEAHTEIIVTHDRDLLDRLQLSDAPRAVHSCLDIGDVHGAASTLIKTFVLITKYARQYPLANVLTGVNPKDDFCPPQSAALLMQIKMIYLHLQSIPLRIIQMSKQYLLNLSQSCSGTARALSAIHLLNVQKIPDTQRANKLMDLYFDSKTKVIHDLLDKLSPRSMAKGSPPRNKKDSTFYSEESTDAAEKTISEILLILQYDIILYPCQIFMLRRYEKDEDEDNVIGSLPQFDVGQLKTKISNFLAAHLPLIRSKVKAILIGIAGTTASRLGHMRQSLYDKTDGADCLRKLSSGICTWEEAINLIDVKVVTRALEGLTTTAATAATNTSISSQIRGFSLWGTLFSNTFSSLVHSILTTSFHSVHRQVISALRASLANAPPFKEILPHEAYRNTLHIATELDKALKKVSDDAHELLVHAEEREESERRLKQSLYVQTCEIMGRLLNELRRMLAKISSDDDEIATKELILGRLCYLLKFRLTSLPTLLDPNSSPAVIASKSGGKVGMITIVELQSAFEISDVDDDGVITYEESLEAMEGAFSGTHFHGAEMVHETMLLSSGSDVVDMKGNNTFRTLTLSELALLSARGLKHAANGPESALGTIQIMLDGIVDACLAKWAVVALSPSLNAFMSEYKQFILTASAVPELEWKRLHLFSASSEEDLLQQEIGDALEDEEINLGSKNDDKPQIGNVSSFLVNYFVSIACILNQSVSPSDSMQQFPSSSYAIAMGIDSPSGNMTMMKLLRSCLMRESLLSLSKSMHEASVENDDEEMNPKDSGLSKCGISSLVQMLMDVTFILNCYFERNQHDFGGDLFLPVDENTIEEDTEVTVSQFSSGLLDELKEIIVKILNEDQNFKFEACQKIIDRRHGTVLSSCGMFFTSIFGECKVQSAMSHIDALSDSQDSADYDDTPLLLNPMPSSRRFMLLPIQAEQSVKELELIQNLEKERSNKAEAERKSTSSAAASAVSSSFGFFSSMLNKKK